MRTILGYIINMIPYMILSMPIFIISRFIINKKKNNKVNWYREIALLIFIVFMVVLASQTVFPKFEFGVNKFSFVKNDIYQTNLPPLKIFFDTYKKIFMFMPFGFFYSFIMEYIK